MTTHRLDVVIFGGGAAGLWLLDTLVRRNYSVLLLEAHALGSGQTVAAQGIIHGGLKYTLDGLFNRSADAIRAMPDLWRDCLAGDAFPLLTQTLVRAPHCRSQLMLSLIQHPRQSARQLRRSLVPVMRSRVFPRSPRPLRSKISRSR